MTEAHGLQLAVESDHRHRRHYATWEWVGVSVRGFLSDSVSPSVKRLVRISRGVELGRPFSTLGNITFTMEIHVDDLTGPEIAAFLEEHIRDMRSVSPPESKHALDLPGLRIPEITFWTLRHQGTIAGCCALRQLDCYHGEVKSMRTSRSLRRQGIGARLLEHVIREASARGYRRLSLETGAMDFFEPARRLYRRFGFEPCGPFSTYKEDPNSVFLTKLLEPTMPHQASVPHCPP